MQRVLIADFEVDDVIAGDGDGWDLRWGSELIFQHVVPQANAGDAVLDVCSGTGRASNVFGMKGCKVFGIDIDPSNLDAQIIIAEMFRFPYIPVKGDALQLLDYFPSQKFDFVLMLDALVHQKKSDALAMIAQAVDLLETGGVIYVDGPSTSNYQYDMMQKHNKRIDRDTFLDLCSCTGTLQYEPFCFFHPGELAKLLATMGMHVTQSYADWFEYQTYRTVCIARK